MEYVRPLSTEEAIERIHVVNDAIQRWTERPIATWPRYERPKRRKDVYYDGRFYDSDEVLHGVQTMFQTDSWEGAFRAAFRHAFAHHGRLSESAVSLQEVMLRDAAHGATLPAFMVAAYLESRS